ncbi:MAG: WG repeat-containing protein [Ferruginibacter sp.]
MKPVLTFLLLIITCTCFSQKILIPYRSGNLFGLCDENGKIIVTPQYDQVSWMQDAWFKTSRKAAVKDSFETAPGKFHTRNSTVTLSGLINNGNIILKDEIFTDYELVAKKCIVAEFYGRGENLTSELLKKYGKQRRLYGLFNLQGKNMYPDYFKRIQKVDTTGISSKDKKSGRYILFVGIQFDDKFSMFVFDADQQKISEWLVKDAFKIEAERKSIANQQIAFTITDKNAEKSSKVLDYTSGKFILTASPAKPTPKNTDRTEQVEVVEAGPGGYDDVPVPPAAENSPVREKPKFNPYYIFAKDTLYYLTSYESKHPLKLPPNGKVFLIEPRGMTQYQPVIAKAENQFYIVKEDHLGAVAYDSLIYFGSYFLAWKKINGQVKAGMITAGDSAIIPFEYDSLYADMRLFNMEDKSRNGQPNYSIILREADSKYSYGNPYPYKRALSNVLTVFRNGQCGLISIKGETIIPIQYQLIAKNNEQFSLPRMDEFILLKQHDLYGMSSLQYSKDKKQLEAVPIIAPVLKYTPHYYLPGYYGVKGFTLIGLYDDQLQFKGFASSTGKLYYND